MNILMKWAVSIFCCIGITTPAVVAQSATLWDSQNTINPLTDAERTTILAMEQKTIMPAMFIMQYSSEYPGKCAVVFEPGKLITGEAATITYRIDSEPPVVVSGATVVKAKSVNALKDISVCKSIASDISKATHRLVVNIVTTSEYLSGDEATHVFAVGGSTAAAHKFSASLPE